MKKFVVIFVFLASCAEARFEQQNKEQQKEDVVYSFKKEFACVEVPEAVTQSVKFSERSGRFFVDNEVVLAHTECSFVDIAVCGTLTDQK